MLGIKLETKELYKYWKHQLGSYLFLKDKDYLGFVGGQFPGLDLHHLLHSAHSKKTTDYLVYPIPHEQHLGEVHGNIPAAFEIYYKPSMRLLASYKKHLANEPIILGVNEFIHYSPEEFISIVKDIKELKGENL